MASVDSGFSTRVHTYNGKPIKMVRVDTFTHPELASELGVKLGQLPQVQMGKAGRKSKKKDVA